MQPTKSYEDNVRDDGSGKDDCGCDEGGGDTNDNGGDRDENGGGEKVVVRTKMKKADMMEVAKYQKTKKKKKEKEEEK